MKLGKKLQQVALRTLRCEMWSPVVSALNTTASGPRSIGDSGVRWVDAQRRRESDEVILFLHKDPA